MKLIIDIPDTTYAFVKQLHVLYLGRRNYKTIQRTVINAIKFGIKQEQGEWIIDSDIYCRCPFCYYRDVKYSNYCPNCGAVLSK